MRTIRAGAGYVLLANAMMFLASACVAQTGAATPQGSAGYHIEVTLLGRGQEKGVSMPPPLFKKDFSIVQNGHKLTARITQPVSRREIAKNENPPHLLLLYLSGVQRRPSDREIVASLSAAFQSGWSISLSRTDGSTTAYCSSAQELDGALGHSSVPSAGPKSEQDAALDRLAAYPGRRVLLLGALPRDTKVAWLEKQVQTFGEIYLINGGRKKDIYHYFVGESPHGVTTQETVMANNYDGRGIANELNLVQAVKSSINDDLNYYDIEITNPQIERPKDYPITLTLRDTGSFLASGALYQVVKQPGSTASDSTRLAMSSGLSIVRR
jgi:hypothetical protein